MRFFYVFLLALPLFATSVTAQDQTNVDLPAEPDVLDIPYTKFTLDNGLTLIVHEDRKAPIAAVNVWYHVGSKNETPGRTGFAHLFEHLMFNGSENYDDDYFQVLERIGATDLNGTTNNDRTNYFQNVPVNALDRALWMESDRMGHLLGAIDQGKLDEQRDVVKNEKRQGENQPYGRVFSTIFENVYPEGHPYSWPVIGSMEDLNAASLDDVKEWFERYYGAANAVVVIAGDIDPETAKQKVETYFGDITPGPPVTKAQRWIPKWDTPRRATMEDRVPQARVYLTWNMPEWGSADADDLELFSDVLTYGKTSRLYKRLVYEDQVATNANSFAYGQEIAGMFVINASVAPGADMAAVEAAIREEVQQLLEDGPTQQELNRVVTLNVANFVRGAERIGGFGGKSDILAQSEVYGGAPDAYKNRLRRFKTATPERVVETARRWLKNNEFTLEVVPFPDYAAAETGADRSDLPPVDAPPAVDFPALQRATLSNGLDVVLAERHATPIVRMDLLVDAGYAADREHILGTASLAMNMLDEGAGSMNALEIAEALDMLGASVSAGSDVDASVVQLDALTDNLGESMDLYAQIVLNPTFPANELARLKQEQLARIKREQSTPVQMALRVFPQLLYGTDHPYGVPLTGSGTEESVAQIERQTLVDFHSTWFRPNNATLVVTGAVTMDQLLPMLEARFGTWEGAGVPAKPLAEVPQKEASKVYLIDRPGAEQSIIFAGHVAPPKANPDELALTALNEALGGSFTSRVNMNLREDKGWSYGASTIIFDAKGQRPFFVYAPVQSDKTMESMQEIQSELTNIRGGSPVTQEELTKIKASRTLSLPGRWETNDAVANALIEIVTYGLDDGHYQAYADAVRGLDLDAVRATSSTLQPDRLVWVIVGDRGRIESSVRELGLGEVEVIEAM